ncbi:MAG: dihydroorotate dehydrogenase-like protein [Bryobacterales bacterium]|nr:dihydroorotate dehydrogenase-like protein [Bryobacterales bacterium]
MPDLTTTYLGLKLKNPLVVSPSPLTEQIGNILRMEDAGAGCVVLHSLFEEQILIESQQLDSMLSAGTESFAESLSYFPDMQRYNFGTDGYLEVIRKAKQAVNIPIIASLNGVSTGGWIRYAKEMEEAGADALELNIFFVANDSRLTSDQVEEMYTSLVSHVKASVRIPVAVKLAPYFSSMANMARKLDQAGADGLVLFNRFYQPDFDLEALDVKPTLGLSAPNELLLRLHWVATLYGQVKADMAITGGVHTAQEVLKSMMAGAKVAMVTTAILKHGIEHMETILADLRSWMEEHEYESIRQMQGSMSRRNVADPGAFSRANYMKILSSYAVRAATQ